MFNKLPIYNALITNEQEGIIRISLVDFPAVESNWLAFDKQEKKLTYSIENEDERMICGVVMRCNFPIYRRDDDGYEYYIMYDKETIKTMAQKLMADGNQNRIDTMHNGQEVEGVNLLQLFIKDSEKGINPVGFEDLEDGSLFAQYHVENDEIWEEIKAGTFKGFSLEGLFDVEKKQNYNKQNNISIMKKIKQMLAKMLLEMGAVATDKGILVWQGEENLKEGDIVTLEDGSQPEDGDYKTEDGKVISIEEGKVAKIADAEAEVAPEEEEEKVEMSAERQKFESNKVQFEASYQEIERNIYSALEGEGVYAYVIENGNDYAIVSVWDGESERERLFRYEISIAEDGTVSLGEKIEVRVEYVPVEEQIQEPEAEPEPEPEVAEEPSEVEQLRSQVAELQTKLAEIEKQPAAEPIVEEFEKAADVNDKVNQKLSRALKRVATLKH